MWSTNLFKELANTEPNNLSICVLNARAYPFFGSSRQFRVCQPSTVQSRLWWENYLREHRVQLVAIRFDRSQQLDLFGWVEVKPWLKSDPESYNYVENLSHPYDIYRVRMNVQGERP